MFKRILEPFLKQKSSRRGLVCLLMLLCALILPSISLAQDGANRGISIPIVIVIVL